MYFLFYGLFLIAYATIQSYLTDVKVLFFGDSLLNRPYSEFGLAERVDSTCCKQRSINYINSGTNGNRIADLRERVNFELKLNRITSSDFIFLVWDSDASDVNEDELSANEVVELRSRFNSNLSEVLTILLGATPFLAVGGPIILGEGNECNWRLEKMDSIEYYYWATRNITAAYNVTYLDIRTAFLESIPKKWQPCRGLLTIDGEHPNSAGTDILAEVIARQISKWLPRVKMKGKVQGKALYYWKLLQNFLLLGAPWDWLQ